MRKLQEQGCGYFIDWEIVGVEGGNALHMLNPFDANLREADHWVHMLSDGSPKKAGREKVLTLRSNSD